MNSSVENYLNLAIDNCFSSMFDGRNMGSAMQSLGETIGMQGCVFLPCGGPDLSGFLPPSTSLEECGETYLAEKWYLNDLRYKRGIGKMRMGLVPLEQEDISNDYERVKLPYYQQFLAKHDWLWWAGFPLQVGTITWCLSLQRTVRHEPITREQTSRLVHCNDRLQQFVSTFQTFRGVHTTTMLDTLNQLARAAILLAQNGKVLACNKLGESYLGIDIFIRHGFLKAANTVNDEALARFLVRRTFAASDKAGANVMTLTMENGSLLMFEALHMNGPMHEIFSNGYLLLLLTEIRSRRPASADKLRIVFGLTESEGRVAALLSVGDSPAMIGAALGIGKETVKTHLRSIFAKCGVSRQSEFAVIAGRV